MTGRTQPQSKPTIVTVSDRTYLPAACCQLVSTAQHLPHADAADLTLVLCDVDKADVEHARRFFQARTLPVRVIEVDFADEIFTINSRWTRAAYLRLYFDRLFDERVGRLIYLDADTRVRAPLAPLLSTDLRGRPAAAVHDFIYYVTGHIYRRRRDLMLGQDGPYLQSGVMVFDWPQMLAQDYLGAARRFLETHPDRCYEAPDQDALNHALHGHWTPLDPRWNLHEFYLLFGGRRKAFIEHYTSTKPWSQNRQPGWRHAARWYRDLLADTPWADFVEPQSLAQAFSVAQKFHRSRISPRRKLKENVPFLLDAIGIDHSTWDQDVSWFPRSSRDINTMVDAMIEEAAGRRNLLSAPEAVLTPPMRDPRHQGLSPVPVT
ncbi:MAG: glycosyltransferase family 8 protein [Alphaproteobacteria bacterium]